MNIIRKMRRDAKALSPIFAVLILIAIAVIAGIIVYMFTSGALSAYTGGATAAQEKVAVEAVETTDSVTLVVWAKSTGGGPVVIDGAILKNSTGATVEVIPLAAADQVTLTADGALMAVDVTFTVDMVLGDMYTVTLTSKGGGSFVSAAFKASW